MKIEERLRRTFSARAGSAGHSDDAWQLIRTGLVRRRRRRAAASFLAAGAALLLVAASTAWLWAALRGSSGTAPGSGAEAEIRPRVAATIPVGEFPAGIAVGEGSIWVAVPGPGCRGHVARIDPATNEIIARIPVNGWPSNLAVGFGSAWVEGLLCTEDDGDVPAVTRIDPRTNSASPAVPLGSSSGDVAAGEGAVWVTVSGERGSGEVVRIDPATGEVVARIPVEGDPRDVVVGEGAVWVLSRPQEGVHLCPADASCLGGASPSLSGMEVVRVDPKTNEVVATFPDALSVGVGEGALWMSVWLTAEDPGLVRVDPATGRRLGDALTGDFRGFAGEHGTMGTLVGDGGVWLWGFARPGAERGQISRLDAATLEIDASVAPGGLWIDAALAPGGETLWISNYEDTITRIDLR
ncbi:MAG: hypothetical protein ACRDIX_08875 [Actinomycetota bacterium]